MSGVFSGLQAWRERRQILRELKQQGAIIQEAQKFKIKDQLTYATEALLRDDKRQALALWEQVVAKATPNDLRTPLALRVMLGLRKFDEARKEMQTGMRRAPGDSFFPLALGQIAQAENKHAEAVALYEKLRKRFPGAWQGYVYGAEALQHVGRVEDADTVSKQAFERFPDRMDGYLAYARVAVQRQDWAEALRRWEPVRDRFHYPGGYVGSAEALSHLGRFDEAEEVIQKSRYRFGTEPAPLIEFARIAEAKGDAEEAIKRWNAVMVRFPLDIMVYSRVAEAVARLGDLEGAEQTLWAAVERFPSEAGPALELAKLLHDKRHDWSKAAEAWAAYRALVPDSEQGYLFGAQALEESGRDSEGQALRAEHQARFKRS
jgi:tetratricopeptide (TPR) repeat protein